MLDKRLWKQITAAIMSCTLAVGTASTNTMFATAGESSITGNIKQEEKSPRLSRILAECKEVKSDSNQIKIRKGETVSVESIVHNGKPSAAIMSNGDLYCWGDNGFGEVGNGTTKEQLTPVKVLNNVKFAVCNESGSFYNTMMAITENGDLYCWGYNGDGQVGNGTAENQLTPFKVLDNVKSIDSYGERNSLVTAITENGDLYCWGENEYGKTGNGTTEYQFTPVKVLDNVKSVNEYYNTMAAITENGDLYCWGYNVDGQVGNGATEEQLTPVKVLDKVKSVSEYYNIMAAITENGDLYCWGYNMDGQVGNGATESQLTPVKVLDNVKSIDSYSESNSLMTAITENGDLYCWGYNEYGQVGNGKGGYNEEDESELQLTPFKVLDKVKSVKEENGTTTAITENGDLYCWGYNVDGQIGNGTTEKQLTPFKVLDKVKFIDIYSNNMMAITENGDLYCWGDNENGQVGNGTTDDQLTPFKVLDNVKFIDIYSSTMTAITENGDLYRWGNNMNSQVGNGTTDDQLTPFKVLDKVKLADITMAITENGDLYCWGSNGDGQVGNGTTEYQYTPVKVLDNVKSASSGESGTMMAVKENGDLYCWGNNMGGDVGNGTTKNQLTPVKILFLEDASEVPSPSDKPDTLQKQKIVVKTASKKYTGDSLKKSKKTFNIGASAMTDISYKVTSGSKYVSVNKNGVVTVKKNTPKGTYKIRVVAEATDEYEKAEKIVKVTVTAATPALKKVNINWDLKNNKTVKFSMDSLMYNTSKGKYYSDRKTGTVTIKNFKKVSKGNKYKVTFTIIYNHPTNFSQKDVDGIINVSGDVFGVRRFWAPMDYQTGEQLKDNLYNVKVKNKTQNASDMKKFYGSNGYWYFLVKTVNEKITIIYPKNYKNLCIIAGGLRKRDLLASERDNSHIDFDKKAKNDKLYFHGMRVK